MYRIRHKDERGTTRQNWLDSKHTFSFAGYYDTKYMGFGALRVINDDIIAPSGGFSPHHHDNMEIITIILSGSLEHKDSMGNTAVIKPFEVQKMTAGTGIIHSEFNPSSNESVHLLQIWIIPSVRNLTPSYQQIRYNREDMLNQLCLIASHESIEGSIGVHQDVKIYQSIIEKGKIVDYKTSMYRRFWIQVALGEVSVNSQIFSAGDALAIQDEDDLLKIKGMAEESNIVIFDLA